MTDKIPFFENAARYTSNDWPTLLSCQRQSPEVATIQMRITPNVSWFEGHFPGTPVLPGIVQTHWAGEFGRDLFQPSGQAIQLENIKFSEVVLPDTECILHLEYDTSKNRVLFRYDNGDHLYSSGRLRFT